MICLLLNADGSVVESSGTPNYYLENKDFNNMLINPDLVKAMVERLGDGITVGILGSLTSEGYVEDTIKIEPTLEEPEQGDLSFYTKLMEII